MNCEQISNQLIAYMDGRANAAGRHEVETHMEMCPGCRARVEEFGKLWSVLDEAPALERSFGFDARLRQRVAVEPRPRIWGWMVPAPRPVFAVALLAVMSVWVSMLPTDNSGQAVTAQSEQEFRMIKDLNVLENYDVLSNLDALSELPVAPQQAPAQSPADREM